MESQADGDLVARHDSQQDEPWLQSGRGDVSREAVLSHTGEVFEALQQKVEPACGVYRSKFWCMLP